jgi:hypothetical protein
MHSKSKADYYQTNLTLPKKGLWEKFPELKRTRCRELVVQLLCCVVLNPTPTRRQNERED